MTVRTCLMRLIGASDTRRNSFGGSVLLTIALVGFSISVMLSGLFTAGDRQENWSRPTESATRPLVVRPATADHLETLLEQARFDLQAVRDKAAPVPRIYVRRLPKDLVTVSDTELRKKLFFGALLPLILMANEELRTDRKQVEMLHERYLDVSERDKFGDSDRRWLDAVHARYGTEFGDWQGLFLRLDEVPVSLIMAQAIQESGWGTSRFAREGNALFGQRTWNPEDDGIVPDLRAEGESYRVKSFPDLMAAIRAYMLNLNTHKAYRDLRARRAQLRQAPDGGDPGQVLAASLTLYSEESGGYVKALTGLIRDNDLKSLNPAQLGSPSDLMVSRMEAES